MISMAKQKNISTITDHKGVFSLSELRAGIVTFLSVSYIIIVNPIILSNAGIPASAVLTATILVSSISCILMGLWAKLPFALAPGMGINSFFAFSLVLGSGLSWQSALAAVFISGIIFIVLSIVRVRQYVFDMIPRSLRLAISAGIGLFIAHIGLQWAGVIAGNPNTVVQFGGVQPSTIFFFLSVALIALLLHKKVKGALLIGIIANSGILMLLSRFGLVSFPGVSAQFPGSLLALPDFSGFWQMDFSGILKFSLIVPVFTLLFTDLFDSIATFVGLSESAGFIDPQTKRPKNINQALLVDGIATTLSGMFGTSSATVYLESATGIKEGGKNGWTAIICGVLFLPFLFFSPLISLVPTLAVAPILVLVGIFMMKNIQHIDWNSYEIALPCFLTILLIPLTYSITQGIIWGLLSYHLVMLVQGKFKEIHPLLWITNLVLIPIYFLG